MRVIFTVLVMLVAFNVSAKIYRDPDVVRQFKRTHACPATGKYQAHCEGYIVDHIMPLACGGPDAVSNMQWQTYKASKEKDRWEIRGDATHKPCSGKPN